MFSRAKRLQERRAGIFQLLLQSRSAIAVAAGPRFFTVVVAALAAVVCILHFPEIKIFFPIRPFFLQRRGTVTDFHPAHRAVIADPRIPHIAQVLALGDGALAKLFILDGLKKVIRATGFNVSLNQVPHGK